MMSGARSASSPAATCSYIRSSESSSIPSSWLAARAAMRSTVRAGLASRSVKDLPNGPGGRFALMNFVVVRYPVRILAPSRCSASSMT
jgi:hypothetical protein